MSNLLDKASIILTPTAYDNSKVLCVKPSTSPYGDFDFSRNSSATRVNAQGLIEDVQILSSNLVQNGDFSEEGSELITNGDFATDTDWTKGTGWTIGGGVTSCDGTQTAGTQLEQNGTYTINKTYKITYTIVSITAGSIDVRLKLGGALVAGTVQTTSGTYTEYLTSTGNTAFALRGDANFIGSIANVSVKEVGQDWSVTGSDANNYVVFNGSTARLKFLNTSPVTQLITSFVMTAGKKYKLTVDIATVTSGVIKVDGNGISETFNTPGITTRIINPTGATAIKFYRASANVDITLNSVSVIEITDDTNLPRINYSGFTYDGSGDIIPNSGCGAWLFEPQSTNLITESENFSDSSWGKTATIVVSNSTISPDGTQNASKIQSTQTGTSYVAPNNLTLTIGNTYTFSCFAKKGNNDWIRLAHITSGGTGCWFDLENGVVGTVNSQSATIEDYGNGWYRCTNTFIATSATNLDNAFIGICDADGSTNAGVIGKNDYVYGAMLEQLSYATSYIPTSGTTVTRNQDLCNNGGDASLINSSEGVLYVKASFEQDAPSSLSRISISDGSVQNRVLLFKSTTNKSIGAIVSSGNASQFNTSFVYTGSADDFFKIAIKWKENDFALWVNGVEVATDNSGTTPVGLSKLQFAGGGGTYNPFYGKTKALAVWKEALTDAELTALTTI